MDPNEALRRYRLAVEEGDEEEAYEAAEALRAWLDRGGFRPRGLHAQEERALRRDAAAGRGHASGRKSAASTATYGKLHRGKSLKGITFRFVLSAATAKRSGWTGLGDDKRRTANERAFYKRVRNTIAKRLGKKVQGTTVRAIDVFIQNPGFPDLLVDHLTLVDRLALQGDGHASGDRPAREFVVATCDACGQHSQPWEVPFGSKKAPNPPPTVVGWMNKHGAMHGRVPHLLGRSVGFKYDPARIDKPWVKEAVAKAKRVTAAKKRAREEAAAQREEDRWCMIEARKTW